MRIFVAGAAGAIGRQIVPMLAAAGHAVTGTTRSDERARWLETVGATRPSWMPTTRAPCAMRSPARGPRS